MTYELPDVESACARIIRDAGVAGGRVYSSIPKTPTYPLCIVQRLGGQPVVRERLDRARIQVDVWGNSKSEAYDILVAARQALFQAEGKKSSEDLLFITAVEDEIGPTWLPDSAGAFTHDHYVISLAIYSHPSRPGYGS